jgi:uncharacterized membrane protein
MQPVTTVVILLAALTTAVTGGVYVAFSAMVMPSLRDSPDATGTMNRINVRAPRSFFKVAFFGSLLTCLAGGVLVLGELPEPDAVLALVGAVAGVAGFVVTVAVNIPLNNRLAAGTVAYPAFAARWRRANAWRGLFSLVGATALATALAI